MAISELKRKVLERQAQSANTALATKAQATLAKPENVSQGFSDLFVPKEQQPLTPIKTQVLERQATSSVPTVSTRANTMLSNNGVIPKVSTSQGTILDKTTAQKKNVSALGDAPKKSDYVDKETGKIDEAGMEAFASDMQNYLNQFKATQESNLNIVKTDTGEQNAGFNTPEFNPPETPDFGKLSSQLWDEFFNSPQNQYLEQQKNADIAISDARVEREKQRIKDQEEQALATKRAQAGALAVSTRGGQFVANVGLSAAYDIGAQKEINRMVEAGELNVRELEAQRDKMVATYGSQSAKAYSDYVDGVVKSYEDKYDNYVAESKSQRDFNYKLYRDSVADEQWQSTQDTAERKFQWQVYNDLIQNNRDLTNDQKAQAEWLQKTYGYVSDGLLSELGKSMGLPPEQIQGILAENDINKKKAKFEVLADSLDMPKAQREEYLKWVDAENAQKNISLFDSIAEQAFAEELDKKRQEKIMGKQVDQMFKSSGGGGSSSGLSTQESSEAQYYISLGLQSGIFPEAFPAWLKSMGVPTKIVTSVSGGTYVSAWDNAMGQANTFGPVKMSNGTRETLKNAEKQRELFIKTGILKYPLSEDEKENLANPTGTTPVNNSPTNTTTGFPNIDAL